MTAERKPKTPRYVQVSVDELAVDPRYQRELNEANMKRMGKLDPRLLGLLVVSQRHGQGRFYVLDGQHRAELARRHGQRMVWVELFVDLTDAEEAEVFHKRNTQRTLPNTLTRWKSRLAYKEPVAVAVTQAVQDAGWRIAASPGGAGLRCPDALESIYRAGGADAIKHVLGVVKRAWGQDGEANDSRVIAGVWAFHRRYALATDSPGYSTQHLVKRLKLKSPGSLMSVAKTLQTMGGRTQGHFARAILGVYNHGLMKHRLPDLFLMGDEEAA